MPAWSSVATADLAYIRTGDVEELYDLTGVRGVADPYETEDRIDDPAYLGAKIFLQRLLRSLSSRPPGDG